MLQIGDMVVRSNVSLYNEAQKSEIGFVSRIKKYNGHSSYFVYWLNNDNDQLQYAYNESQLTLVSKVNNET